LTMHLSEALQADEADRLRPAAYFQSARWFYPVSVDTSTAELVCEVYRDQVA